MKDLMENTPNKRKGIFISIIAVISFLLFLNINIFLVEPNPELSVCFHCRHDTNFDTYKAFKSLDPDWIRTDWYHDYDMNLYMDLAQELNIKTLGIIDHNTFPTGYNFTLTEFENEVKRIVQEFPDVEAWEILNEPNDPIYNFGYYNGTPERYYQLLQTSYNIIKTYSPNALVVFGGVNTIPEWQPFLSTLHSEPYNAEQFYDVLGIHIYFKENISNQLIMKYLQSLTNKPIWVTEIGQPVENGDQTYQSDFMKESFNMLQYECQNIFWYQIAGDEFGLIDENGTPRQSFFTFMNFQFKK